MGEGQLKRVYSFVTINFGRPAFRVNKSPPQTMNSSLLFRVVLSRHQRRAGPGDAASGALPWPKAASLVGAVLQSCCTADFIALTALQCRVLALRAAEAQLHWRAREVRADACALSRLQAKLLVNGAQLYSPAALRQEHAAE